MAYNNTLILTGFLGDDPKIIEGEEKQFAAFSIATADSYKDKETNEWKDKKKVWHDVVAFSPKLIEKIKSFKKGDRIEVTASLSYRDFQVEDEGKIITKKIASIIARKVEDASFKSKEAEAA